MLLLSTSLPVAVIGLVVLGGPAGVGSSLLYAHLRHSGASVSDVVNTRAIVSVAWVAGPPLATLIIGWFGNQAILVAIGVVAVLSIATTSAMLAQQSRAGTEQSTPAQTPEDGQEIAKLGVALIVAAFVILQATNATVVSILTLFVTDTLRMDVIWAGIALGVAAGLEIPALVFIGRLSRRYSSLGLIASGCVAGIAYYVGMAYVSGPVLLIGLQALNSWFFAAVAGIGLTLFQQIIPQARAGHRPLHEYSPGRCHRVRTDHRHRLNVRARLSRHLRRVCGAHRCGSGSDLGSQSYNQAPRKRD